MEIAAFPFSAMTSRELELAFAAAFQNNLTYTCLLYQHLIAAIALFSADITSSIHEPKHRNVP